MNGISDTVSFNPFTRISNILNLKITVNGIFPLLEHLGFVNSQSIMQLALITEASMYPTTAHKNLRSTLSQLEYLKPFVVNNSGILQLPILFIISQVSGIIFGDIQLRGDFNAYVVSQSPILGFVDTIGANVRGTQNNRVSATLFTSNTHSFYANTILDSEFLKNNEDSKLFAFSLITGSLVKEYQLPYISYNAKTYYTEMCTSSSIYFSLKSIITMQIYPFSTCKVENYMFDPTLLQAFTCLFFGLELTQYNSNSNEKLSFGSQCTSFNVNITKYNVFTIYYSFLRGEYSGYCNPYSNSNSNSRYPSHPSTLTEKRKVDHKSKSVNNAGDISIMANTSLKKIRGFSEEIVFLNNLFEVDKALFHILARKTVSKSMNYFCSALKFGLMQVKRLRSDRV